MSRIFKEFHVTDVYESGSSSTHRILKSDYFDDTDELVQIIRLFPKTARTNVCFKGHDGKFISYRDLENSAIRDAVESLIPFPEA